MRSMSAPRSELTIERPGRHTLDRGRRDFFASVGMVLAQARSSPLPLRLSRSSPLPRRINRYQTTTQGVSASVPQSGIEVAVPQSGPEVTDLPRGSAAAFSCGVQEHGPEEHGPEASSSAQSSLISSGVTRVSATTQQAGGGDGCNAQAGCSHTFRRMEEMQLVDVEIGNIEAELAKEASLSLGSVLSLPKRTTTPWPATPSAGHPHCSRIAQLTLCNTQNTSWPARNHTLRAVRATHYLLHTTTH